MPQSIESSWTALSSAVTHPRVDMHLVGTDGWVSMPAAAPADPPFFPDSYAPSPFNTYVFGFRDATGLSDTQVAALQVAAEVNVRKEEEIPAPLALPCLYPRFHGPLRPDESVSCGGALHVTHQLRSRVISRRR